jgi:hypothetical protein
MMKEKQSHTSKYLVAALCEQNRYRSKSKAQKRFQITQPDT